MAGNTFGTTTTVMLALVLWLGLPGSSPAARAAGFENRPAPDPGSSAHEPPAERCESCGDRYFIGLAAEPESPQGSWDIGTFAVAKLFSGETDRHVIAMPASGGVIGAPEGALDRPRQLQLSGNGLLRRSDLLVLAARHQHNAAQLLESLGLWTRLPLGSAWRLGPRLRVDRRETDSGGRRETQYLPSLRLDYERGDTWLGFECGAELGRRSIPGESERSRRYFVSFGYHITF